MTKKPDNLRTQWAQARATAYACGNKFYDGRPCVMHGKTQRYTSNFCCVICRKIFRKKRKTEKVYSVKGDAIYEKLRRETPEWPEMSLAEENIQTGDYIGSRTISRQAVLNQTYASAISEFG